MSRSKIKFELNGSAACIVSAPQRRLSQVLRDDLGLTGTKVGCNAGDCGACTVLLDDRPVCACMTAAQQVAGRSVETVEGLADRQGCSDGRLQQSFLRHGAAQCGICTPGMLVAAEALLRKNPNPNEQQVKDAIGGVLCRCTGYRKIIQAIMATNQPDAGMPPQTHGKSVGARIARLDGAPKLSGDDVFGADVWPDDSLLIRVVRSPYARASFRFGDLDDYVANTPGVVAIFTASSVPGENIFGVIPDFADQPVFAESETRFEGEAIAMVVGEPCVLEVLDISTIPVVWKPLQEVMTCENSQDSAAPRLHANREGNCLTQGFVRSGNTETGLKNAEAVVEGRFSSGFIEHAYIEPEAGFARRVGDRIEVQACTQAPYMDRDGLATILGIEPKQVRIIPTSVGGGFGSKLDLSLQPFIALAAWHLNKPVKIVYSRQESMMSTTKRHPSDIWAKISADKHGKISSMEFVGTFNTGAYASWGPTVANRVPIHASGPYSVDNYSAKSIAIHTHCPPAGAFRGFGVPQSAVAQETLFDLLAEKLKIDPLDFRIRNALENNAATVTGQRFKSGVGIKKCFEALQSDWDEARRWADEQNLEEADSQVRFGVGIAGLWYGCGNTSLPNPSTIRVGLTPAGRIVLFQGAVDIGQGSNTVISQICADAVGLSIELFDLVFGDTDLTADAGKTSASRQTFISGKAAYIAGHSLRRSLLDLDKSSKATHIRVEDRQLIFSSDVDLVSISLRDLPCSADGFVATGQGTFDPPVKSLDKNGQGHPYATYGYGAQMVKLSVDMSLGTVELIKMVAAHDVGKVINPTLAEGQVHGGIAQGIGFALMEEYVPGKTNNLHDYLIPTAGDIPPIDTVFIEEAETLGPFGAKGLGEHVLVGTAPAILNGIRHATGAVIRDLPATPDRVLSAIQQIGNR